MNQKFKKENQKELSFANFAREKQGLLFRYIYVYIHQMEGEITQFANAKQKA